MSEEHALQPRSGDDPVYSFKPSLMGAPWEFRLRADALEWRMGRQEGRILYGRIRRVRLSFRPVTMQTRRFVTEIWSPDAPRLSIVSTSWRSMMEQGTQDDAYGAFISELHRRIAAAGVQASFETGSPALLYWPGLAIFAAGGLGMAALTVRGLQVEAYAGTAFVGAFLGLFLWQSGNYFRRNWPGSYRPDALPRLLVPGG